MNSRKKREPKIRGVDDDLRYNTRNYRAQFAERVRKEKKGGNNRKKVTINSVAWLPTPGDMQVIKEPVYITLSDLTVRDEHGQRYCSLGSPSHARLKEFCDRIFPYLKLNYNCQRRVCRFPVSAFDHAVQ